MIEKLDSLFTVSSVIEGGETSPDISGLIGQYAHGNEPSHHILYLYTMLGQPWKTADKVREVLTTLYHDRPDGLSGNEDVGQMSAWYVLSSLGMYEAEPAGGRYWFGSPLFDRAEVKVPGGVFTITAENNSRCEQIYPAGVAQWSTLHEALDRSCRRDEGAGAALRDGRRTQGVVLPRRTGGVRRPAARGGAAAF